MAPARRFLGFMEVNTNAHHGSLEAICASPANGVGGMATYRKHV